MRFYLPLCFTGGLRWRYLSLYVFTCRSAKTNDLRWRYLSLREERYRRKTRQRAPKPPFGFWLFIRGFGGETCGLFYVCARVQLTRFRPARRRAPEGSALGVPVVFALRGFAGKPGTTFFRQFHCRKHCFRRAQLYCSMCGEIVGTLRITGVICGRKLGGCESAINSTAVQHAERMEAVRSTPCAT